MKINFTLTVLLFITLYFKSSAQTACEEDFKFLVNKIKSDYPGYSMKMSSGLKTLEKDIAGKISKNPDSCFFYLQQYAAFFKDKHLRVSATQTQSVNSRSKNEVSTFGRNLDIDLDRVQKIPFNNQSLEGTWESFNEKIAFIKEKDTYLGLVISKNGWKKGQVAYQIRPAQGGYLSCEIFNLYGDKNWSAVKVVLAEKGSIMEFGGYRYFVRESPNKKLNKATLYTYIPSSSNEITNFPLALSLSDSTFYLRVPDFFTGSSNTLTKKYRSEILAHPNLIIDLRGNVGGQDENYSELIKLIYTNPYTVKGSEWYASTGNIALFEKAINTGQYKNGEEGKRWITSLLGAMRSNRGGFVIHPDDQKRQELVSMDTILPAPKKVGIIISEDNASSAEEFLLAAKQSKKVIVFGDRNTAGVLDYSNITAVDFPSKKYQLYNPMTRSRRLPQSPIDNVGIAPDVVIPYQGNKHMLYDRLDNWPYFVKNYLELPE